VTGGFDEKVEVGQSSCETKHPQCPQTANCPFFLAAILLQSVAQAQTPPGVPVFKITPVESSIKFDVEASVAIKGTFDKWNATLTRRL
jgi:hypothetical protein